MLDIALKTNPEMVMLVPEGRREITTEGGLDLVTYKDKISKMVTDLQKNGIIVSAFLDAEMDQIRAANDCGIQVCEVHTGPYASVFHQKGRDQFSVDVQTEIKKIAETGELINKLGMKFNAGHALNYFNVEPIASLNSLREVHIGHAIISRSIFVA